MATPDDGIEHNYRLLLAIICAPEDECRIALTVLYEENKQAATHLVEAVIGLFPHAAAAWTELLNTAQQGAGQEDATKSCTPSLQSGPPLDEGDAADTAAGLCARLGWQDMEPST
jgi:hypothetical protein